MEEFVKQLGLNLQGTLSKDDTYVIDLDSDEEYNKVFGKLNKSDLIDEADDSSTIDVDESNIMYTSDEYILNLIANFKEEQYRLVVTKIGEDE